MSYILFFFFAHDMILKVVIKLKMYKSHNQLLLDEVSVRWFMCTFTYGHKSYILCWWFMILVAILIKTYLNIILENSSQEKQTKYL